MIDFKIYNEDQLATLANVPDEFIDLTMTSPPYDDMNENFEVVQKGGMRTYEGYSWDFKKLAEELFRTTKPGGMVVWVVNDPVINGSKSLASSFQKIYFRKCGFDILDTMIYEKNGCSMPDKYRYLQCFEYMIVLSKGRPKTVNFLKDRKNRYPERWGGAEPLEKRTERSQNGRSLFLKNMEGGTTFGGIIPDQDIQPRTRWLLNTRQYFLKSWLLIMSTVGRMKVILFLILLPVPEPHRRFVNC